MSVTQRCYVEFSKDKLGRPCASVDLHGWDHQRPPLEMLFYYAENRWLFDNRGFYYPNRAVEFCREYVYAEYARAVNSIITTDLEYCYE